MSVEQEETRFEKEVISKLDNSISRYLEVRHVYRNKTFINLPNGKELVVETRENVKTKECVYDITYREYKYPCGMKADAASGFLTYIVKCVRPEPKSNEELKQLWESDILPHVYNAHIKRNVQYGCNGMNWCWKNSFHIRVTVSRDSPSRKYNVSINGARTCSDVNNEELASFLDTLRPNRF